MTEKKAKRGRTQMKFVFEGSMERCGRSEGNEDLVSLEKQCQTRLLIERRSDI